MTFDTSSWTRRRRVDFDRLLTFAAHRSQRARRPRPRHVVERALVVEERVDLCLRELGVVAHARKADIDINVRLELPDRHGGQCFHAYMRCSQYTTLFTSQQPHLNLCRPHNAPE